MAIKIVVFDIGGILEIEKSESFVARWEERWQFPQGEISRRMQDIWKAGAVGQCSEAEAWAAHRERLPIQSDEEEQHFWNDLWSWYLGTLNTPLYDYFVSLRARYRTGILSNSFVGAREREQTRYGFEDIVESIVYSHEIGLEKPDERIYSYTCERYGVRPEEMLFLDDVPINVEAAQNYGIHAILFENNEQAIADIEACLHAHT